MGTIKGLTPEQKSEGNVYCWNYKWDGAKNLLRNFVVLGIEEFPTKYFLVDDKVVTADYDSLNKDAVSKRIFDFIGHGKHIWSEDANGNPDSRLLRFYAENPDKIPDFHKAIFETLTAPKHRSNK